MPGDPVRGKARARHLEPSYEEQREAMIQIGGGKGRGMSEATPGPLEARCINSRVETGKPWAVINPNGPHGDEIVAGYMAEAEAHLFAAAPDMLAALQEVVAISDRKHDAWDRARAAIAKATGTVKQPETQGSTEA